MFHAMLAGRIDTEGLEFTVSFKDIEELNADLLSPCGQRPHLSKASYAAVPAIASCYVGLNSGSALGRGNGPLLVASRQDADISDPALQVVVPGLHTTANLLLERLFPHLSRKHARLFSDIPRLVSTGKYDAGVLIHEGRFVFQRYGLFLLADLGREWENRTGLPLPLGIIVGDRSLPTATLEKADRVLKRSIEYAFAHPSDSLPFVREHAQEMDERVIRQHIELFVNEHSIEIGKTGAEAAARLLGMSPGEIFRTVE